jgi:hypothetical protein
MSQHISFLHNEVGKMKDIEAQMQAAGDTVPAKLATQYAEAKQAVKAAAKNTERVAPADMIDNMWRNQSVPLNDAIAKLEQGGINRVEATDIVNSTMTDLFQWSGRWSVDDNFKRLITGGQLDPVTGKVIGGEPELLKGQMVPKYMTDALDRLRPAAKQTLIGKEWRGATNIFKYAVLVGPRHVIHVLFSNGMFMALDDMKVFNPAHFGEAGRFALGKIEIPGLQHGIGIFNERIIDEAGNVNKGALKRIGATVEDVHGMREGKTLGRMLRELPKTAASPFRRTEEFITDFSRALEYLYGKDKAFGRDSNIRLAEKQVKDAKALMAPGVKRTALLGKAEKALERAKAAAEPLAHEEGLNQVTKVLMDIDGMSPIERQIFRQVFPFYPFTRQLLRYMAKFPAEHPFKAAVIAAIGRIEMNDAQSGLPTKFMSIFPISGADSSGNALFMDTKNMNPFRSMNGLSPWTRAGFLSELNPMITLPFAASGLNILTASPELYPTLTVDPNTGDLVAKPSRNIAQTAIEQMVPQVSSVESLIGINNQLSQLRQSDPEAYGRLILSNFNIPFSIGPRNINTERIRYARNLYTVAQAQASRAAKSGDVGALPYTYVPYGGQIWSTKQLQKALAGG